MTRPARSSIAPARVNCRGMCSLPPASANCETDQTPPVSRSLKEPPTWASGVVWPKSGSRVDNTVRISRPESVLFSETPLNLARLSIRPLALSEKSPSLTAATISSSWKVSPFCASLAVMRNGPNTGTAWGRYWDRAATSLSSTRTGAASDDNGCSAAGCRAALSGPMLAARSLPSMLTLPSLSCSSVPVPLIFIVAASSRYGGRPGRSNSAPSCAESGVNACSDRFIPVAAIFSSGACGRAIVSIAPVARIVTVSGVPVSNTMSRSAIFCRSPLSSPLALQEPGS